VAEVPHDPSVTLRLELGRVTDQRDAYQSALRKEVLAVIRDAIAETSRLQAEVARLKAEVERLKEGNECLDQMHEKEMARSAFLCEEVNRTTAWGRGLESDLSWARAELLMVKAEVERLKNNIAYLDKKLDEELDK
jgi:uncharacterized small protein (DUF1192 family)